MSAFVGTPMNQVLPVNADKTRFPGVDFGQVRDVILGVECRARV